MKIHNTEIQDAALQACIARMKAAPFRAADIYEVAVANGVPEKVGHNYIAGRAGDRLIQKLRKKGNIRVSYGHQFPTWTWMTS